MLKIKTRSVFAFRQCLPVGVSAYYKTKSAETFTVIMPVRIPMSP